MATGISAAGDVAFSGIISFENNEIHRRVWLNNPADQLEPLLEKIFGDAPDFSTHQFPDPFDSFYAHSVSFETPDKGAQGETEDFGDFDFLDGLPTFRGGVSVDITYRPLDTSGVAWVADEGWDFSAQTMSLIGNNFGQSPQSLIWSSDGSPITNITAIVKIIPKIEFIQTQVFQAYLPAPDLTALIGCVNQSDLYAGASGADNYYDFAPETALLTGIPAIRRWRFDGSQWFQWGIKLACNLYQDTIEDGSTDYVTWNRLYRPDKGYWDRVLVGPNQDDLYPQDELAQVVA